MTDGEPLFRQKTAAVKICAPSLHGDALYQSRYGRVLAGLKWEPAAQMDARLANPSSGWPGGETSSVSARLRARCGRFSRVLVCGNVGVRARDQSGTQDGPGSRLSCSRSSSVSSSQTAVSRSGESIRYSDFSSVSESQT